MKKDITNARYEVLSSLLSEIGRRLFELKAHSMFSEVETISREEWLRSVPELQSISFTDKEWRILASCVTSGKRMGETAALMSIMDWIEKEFPEV